MFMFIGTRLLVVVQQPSMDFTIDGQQYVYQNMNIDGVSGLYLFNHHLDHFQWKIFIFPELVPFQR